jgi:hypothetical protein
MQRSVSFIDKTERDHVKIRNEESPATTVLYTSPTSTTSTKPRRPYSENFGSTSNGTQAQGETSVNDTKNKKRSKSTIMGFPIRISRSTADLSLTGTKKKSTNIPPIFEPEFERNVRGSTEPPSSSSSSIPRTPDYTFDEVFSTSYEEYEGNWKDSSSKAEKDKANQDQVSEKQGRLIGLRRDSLIVPRPTYLLPTLF